MTSDQLLILPLLDESVIQTMSNDVGADTCQQLSLLFIHELEQLLQKISLAIEQQQVSDVIDAVHILKNSAALYGAARLAWIASEIHEDTSNTTTELVQRSDDLVNIAQQTLFRYQAHFKDENKRKGFDD
ncbi:Hpt domain-containing protein [Alishewanella sp. HL-SH05]|uniref:Hpt domain-containing protein n=1 Tax=Alishewanella sp. HL-SH05 TaxID=3461145 RepID=UPI0040415A25